MFSFVLEQKFKVDATMLTSKEIINFGVRILKLDSRRIFTGKFLARGDRWKKLIDSNWLKVKDEGKPRKKIVKEIGPCVSDPCSSVRQLVPSTGEPDSTKHEPVNMCPPATAVKTENQPCYPCPDPDLNHPCVQPECEIPLPEELNLKVMPKEEIPPMKFEKETPMPYDMKIHSPRYDCLSYQGIFIGFPKKIPLDEMWMSKTDLQKKKLRAHAVIAELRPYDLTGVSGVPRPYWRKRRAFVGLFPKNVMQQGTYNTRNWIVKFNHTSDWENPLIGWNTTADSHSNLSIPFSSSTAAVEYCQKYRYDWQFIVPPAPKKPLKPKSYADNFSYDRRFRVSTK